MKNVLLVDLHNKQLKCVVKLPLPCWYQMFLLHQFAEWEKPETSGEFDEERGRCYTSHHLVTLWHYLLKKKLPYMKCNSSELWSPVSNYIIIPSCTYTIASIGTSTRGAITIDLRLACSCNICKPPGNQLTANINCTQSEQATRRTWVREWGYSVREWSRRQLCSVVLRSILHWFNQRQESGQT